MADLTIGANGISLVHANEAEIKDLIAVEAITAGQPVYQTSAGKAGIADANAAGKQQFRGIALKDTAAGKACPVLKRGFLSGYVLTGVAYDGLVYLSDTAGSLADAAGTMTVNCGRVVAKTDPDLTKLLYVEADWLRAWA
jgi:hypothetical protein